MNVFRRDERGRAAAHELSPVCVAPPVATDKGIRFMHPVAPMDVHEHVEELWAILGECTGRQSTSEVVASAGVPAGVASALINDLFGAGILVDGNSLGDAFHAVATRDWLYPSGLTMRESIHYADTIDIGQKPGRTYPLGSTVVSATGDLVARRQSCRSFRPSALTLDELTTLLVNAYSFRVYPVASAGALYPLRIYALLTLAVGELDPGHYQFLPHTHELVRLPIAFDPDALAYAFNSDTLLFGAPAVVMITGDLAVQSRKYGPRGYQLTLVEAGAVTQTVCLTATELGLGSLVSGFDDVALNGLLGLADREVMLAAVAVGHRNPEPTFDATEVQDQLVLGLVGAGRPIELLEPMPHTKYDDAVQFRGAVAVFGPGSVPDPDEPRFSRLGLGTATSSALAGVKAIAEGTERWASMQLRVDLHAVAERLAAHWLDPRVLAPYDEHQIERLNLAPFDPTATWQWVTGTRLGSGESVHVPVDLVFYGPTPEVLGRLPCAWGDSSGVAAHFSPDEAIRRATLELVERDALMRCWLLHRPPPRLPYETLPAHYRAKVDFWHSVGRTVEVLDLSAHHLAIIGVIIHGPQYPCLASGFAASDHSVEQALIKAFQESQFALIHALTEPPRPPVDPRQVWTCSDHAFLYYHPTHIPQVEWLWSGPERAFSTDVAPVRDRFAALGAVAVDLSRGTDPLHVFRVLSPELVPVSFGAGTEHYLHHSLRGEVDPRSLAIPHFYS